MSDAVDRGITVTEIAAMDQPVDATPETTAAFIGRALRGPLNTPLPVSSCGEFRRRFGDTWSRSGLGPAVQQFFEHGGKRLIVVRVANNARGAMICLPASGSALVLRAVEPGSTEVVRAAVDYDGIDETDEERFNLTLQRLDPATGLVQDQEFYRRVSYVPGDGDFVGDALLDSSLARIEHPYPSHRPDSTMSVTGDAGSSYIDSVQAGSDGAELSDYDLVGSRRERSGLFALEKVEHFDLLYLPPPGKGCDAGPTAIMAAELYCRQRGAMLIVDPHAEWHSASDAVRGVRERGYASPNMLGYFPRMLSRGDEVACVAGGAVAGLLCRQDRTQGPWQNLDGPGSEFRPQLLPAVSLDDEECGQLQRAGLNVVTVPAGRRSRLCGDVTMARGSEQHRKFAQLSVRRFCLQIIGVIKRSARWVVFENDERDLAAHIRGQVTAYFHCLNDLGALADERFIVECDAGVSHRSDSREHGVTLILVFHPAGCETPVSMTLHLTATGCRVGSAAFAPSLERRA